ncbi:MAG: HAD-IC family P-type ATPase [Firmicutes bacterium]|nr:HAD-IC family P-type ATPase [Bacillota bacterium]
MDEKSEKKPPAKRTGRVMPKIVTKDTNTEGETPLTKTVGEVIDPDVFSAQDEVAAGEYSRSRTIDGSMLPHDRLKLAAKHRRAALSVSASINYDAVDRFEPDIEAGLFAEQVEQRAAQGLVNVTKKKTSKTYFSIFFGNIFTPINMIAVAVSIALAIFKAEFVQYMFVVIIMVNTSIGIIQEIRAKFTVEKLKLLSAPTATVLRDGERKVIPVSEIVLDDIMYLESGKQICADAIVAKGEMEVNESLLTGESVPVKKSVGSELFSGSFVVGGNCYARVNKVGSANYVETLTSHARKYKKPKSELFNSIGLIIKVIIPIAILLTAGVITAYYLNEIRPVENEISRAALLDLWQTNIHRAAGVMIGMLPTGMFLLTSTALVISVIRLAKRRALVKDLYCIEMLARVNVLCLDKTGTITDGTMVVKDVVEIKGAHEIPYSFNEIIGSVLTATGDNNQTAMALANHFGYSKALSATVTLPFSSSRKLAAVSFGEAGTFLYGAPEFVLKDIGIRIEKLINEYASQGLRVMVLAHSPAQITQDRLPSVRRPLCLIAIEDHIRPDAIETVGWFKENNVDVKVISGDNPITVSEVAKRVGIINAELYISLDGLSNQEVFEAAHKYTVFGRVTPEQKMLLIKALKQKGNTVAMTGDGVNDILAMRESDCAVAIASGAEAARNVAHLVLQDSSFSSMPQVVREGRRVVNNIQQTSSLFLMKTFMTILLAVISLIVRDMAYPFTTSHLLLLEFCVIAMSSFALALQVNTNMIKGKFLSNVIGRSAPGGVTLAMATVAVYLYNRFLILPLPIHMYESLLILCVTITGYMILVKICEPANLFRTMLLIAIAGAIIIMSFVMSGPLKLVAIGLQDGLFLIAVVMGAYFFMSILIKIMKSLKILH